MFRSMFRELVSGDPLKRKLDRIDLLLRKTHVVGRIVVPIPNLFAFSLIQKLDTSNAIEWLCETLFILHFQHNEDILFLRDDDRDRHKAKLLAEINPMQFPDYYIAVTEMLDAVEKKSQSSSKGLQRLAKIAMSQHNSSPSQPKPDNPSATSPTN